MTSELVNVVGKRSWAGGEGEDREGEVFHEETACAKALRWGSDLAAFTAPLSFLLWTFQRHQVPSYLRTFVLAVPSAWDALSSSSYAHLALSRSLVLSRNEFLMKLFTIALAKHILFSFFIPSPEVCSLHSIKNNGNESI